LPAHLRQLLTAVEAEQRQGTLVNGAFEHLLLEREERLRHSLAPSRMLVKVGPSMGLLGTLIPMGTSLASLATGNLEAMAGLIKTCNEVLHHPERGPELLPTMGRFFFGSEAYDEYYLKDVEAVRDALWNILNTELARHPATPHQYVYISSW